LNSSSKPSPSSINNFKSSSLITAALYIPLASMRFRVSGWFGAVPYFESYISTMFSRLGIIAASRAHSSRFKSGCRLIKIKKRRRRVDTVTHRLPIRSHKINFENARFAQLLFHIPGQIHSFNFRNGFFEDERNKFFTSLLLDRTCAPTLHALLQNLARLIFELNQSNPLAATKCSRLPKRSQHQLHFGMTEARYPYCIL